MTENTTLPLVPPPDGLAETSGSGTAAAPSAESPAPGPEPVRPPEAPNRPPGPNEANVGQPGQPVAATVPEPPPADPPAAGTVWCENCRAAVEPSGRGLCPTCGRFLPDNLVALTTGLRSKKLAKIVDAYRVDLIAQLFNERGGKDALDVVSRIAIENYALVCAQHKTIEARLDQDGLFTQTGRRRSAFDMLKSISETIDRLRAELPPPLTRSSDMPGIEAMPTSALDLVQEILKRHIAGEPLTEFEQGELRILRGAMRGQVQLPPDPEDVPVPPARTPIDDGYTILEPGDVGYHEQEAERASTKAQSTPAPEPKCQWCHQTLARCAELKALDDGRWDALHAQDPEHVKAREEQYAAEMMESLRRARTGGIPRW